MPERQHAAPTRRRTPVLAVILLTFASVSHAGPPADPYSITIRPLVDPSGTVAGFRVAEQIDAPTTDGKPLALKAAISAIRVKDIAGSITDLKVSDSAGPIPLTTHDDATGPIPFRHWQLGRPSSGAITISYAIPVQNGALRGGPPLGTASAGHGVAGSGYGLLIVPENLAADRTRVAWDLTAMAPGSIGVFSALAGNGVIEGNPRDMASQWLLAGLAKIDPSGSDGAFHSYVLGDPPFDRGRMTAFARGTYDVLTRRLAWLGRPTYRLMVRVRDGAEFTTGTAGLSGSGSAMITTGTSYYRGQDYDDVEEVIFHEMAHFWVGEIADSGNWFSEGLTVYLTARLPCEEHLRAPTACAGKLNFFLRDYYTSPGRDWSQARIEASGFDPQSVRIVPYARGALYFAELDAKLRTRSGGRRTLIDALRPLKLAAEHGTPLTMARFEAMLQREMGAAAVTDFRAKVLAGTRPIVPPTDAFGPCLQRSLETIRDDQTGATARGYVWRPAALPASSSLRTSCGVTRS